MQWKLLLRDRRDVVRTKGTDEIAEKALIFRDSVLETLDRFASTAVVSSKYIVCLIIATGNNIVSRN